MTLQCVCLTSQSLLRWDSPPCGIRIPLLSDRNLYPCSLRYLFISVVEQLEVCFVVLVFPVCRLQTTWSPVLSSEVSGHSTRHCRPSVRSGPWTYTKSCHLVPVFSTPVHVTNFGSGSVSWVHPQSRSKISWIFGHESHFFLSMYSPRLRQYLCTVVLRDWR